jgi:hypothetical protein
LCRQALRLGSGGIDFFQLPAGHPQPVFRNTVRSAVSMVWVLLPVLSRLHIGFHAAAAFGSTKLGLASHRGSLDYDSTMPLRTH